MSQSMVRKLIDKMKKKEMVECMKKVAKLNVELSVDERNFISVGYKNVTGARIASWRILLSIELSRRRKSKGN